MSNDDLVAVRTFLNKIEADLAQGALEARGVESFVAADDAGGLRPGLWLAGVRLLVRAEDVGRAVAILGDVVRGAAGADRPRGDRLC